MAGEAVRPLLATLAEASTQLGRTIRYLRRLEKRGQLRLVRFGRMVRVPTSEIDRLKGTGEVGR